MKEVILVYCGLDIIDVDSSTYKERRSALNAVQGKSFPPLGLLYLAAVLEKEKIEVGLIDVSLLKGGLKEAIEILKISQPKVIGLYVSSFNLYLVRLLISQLKTSGLKSKIVIGGPHVHYCTDSVQYLGADFGFVSDGEYGFLDLVTKILNNDSDFDNIPNLIRKQGGGVFLNPIKKIENLDSLPYPARHLWPYKEYFSPLVSGKATAAITSRGCVFDCVFCALPDKGQSRVRSAESVVDEYSLLQDQGFTYLELQDDFFTYDKERVERICRELIRKKIKLKWTCLTRADFTDKKLLLLMRKAGCTHIKYGIESGSEKIRNNIMKKFISNSQIEETVKATRGAGIFTVGYFLLGAEEETMFDLGQTLKFAKRLNLDYVDFNIMALIPGSQVFKNALKKGKFQEDIWERVASGGEIPYSASQELKLSQITDFKEKAMREHYFNPGFFFKEIFLRTKGFSSFVNKTKILLNILDFHRRYSNFQKGLD